MSDKKVAGPFTIFAETNSDYSQIPTSSIVSNLYLSPKADIF